MKKCSKCKEIKEIEEYNNSGNGYRRAECKDCQAKYRKENNEKRLEYLKKWAKENPEKRRAQKYRYRYKIDIDQYNTMLKKQGGSCKICKSKDTKRKNTEFFAVDHCHDTGKIRGLLCYNCNSGLGKFNDNPELIKKALDYLLSSSK